MAEPNAAIRTAVLDALPGTLSDIARRMGRKGNDSTVIRHLKWLVADGLVEHEGAVYERLHVVSTPATRAYPAHFDGEARRLFALKVATLVRDGLWDDDRDGELLERYVTAVQVARQARTRIAQRADEDRTDPAAAYITSGSQGQLVQHPDLKTAREAERDAQVYEDKLRDRLDRAPVGDGDDDDMAGL